MEYLNNTMIYRSMHKYVVGEAYMLEIQVEVTFFDTLVTPFGAPSSDSALDNTCIQTFTSTYIKLYWESPRLS